MKDDPKAIALAEEKGVELIWFMMQPEKEELQAITDLLKDGKLRVEIQQIFTAYAIFTESSKFFQYHKPRKQ